MFQKPQTFQIFHMCRKKTFSAALALLFFYLLLALFAPWAAPYDPTEINGNPCRAPDSEHLLGTNDFGQDIFSRLLWGSRATLLFGFLGTFISTGLGTGLGVLTGYLGGRTDRFISGCMDVLMSIPQLPLLLVLSIYLKPGLYLICIFMGLLGSLQQARIIRAKALSVSTENFVYAAKALGLSDFHIMGRYILPSVFPLTLVKFLFGAQHYMLLGVGLSFLGIGDPKLVDWGQMLHQAYSAGGFALGMWNWIFPPCFAMIGLSLSLSLLGYSLEPWLSPQLRHEGKSFSPLF